MVYDIDMDCSSRKLPRKAKKKLLKIGSRFVSVQVLLSIVLFHFYIPIVISDVHDAEVQPMGSCQAWRYIPY